MNFEPNVRFELTTPRLQITCSGLVGFRGDFSARGVLDKEDAVFGIHGYFPSEGCHQGGESPVCIAETPGY